MKAPYRHRLASSMFIAMTLAGLHPLSADEPTDVSSTIQILSAYAEPAPAGACTEVRFKLKNDGREDLQVIGLVTDVASSARLLVQVGSQETVVLDSFGVPSEQTVDFTRSEEHTSELQSLMRISYAV